MSRQRYEPVPQRDQETIDLDTIHASAQTYPHNHNQNYNYNTGIPSSAPSITSTHAPSILTPSILTPSIPSSPPPSFHSHSPSTPGTPRPTPSTYTRTSGYAELWDVAPSTVEGGAEAELGLGSRMGMGGTSNDALATIAGLKQRIEWLEESIGKLLIEKDSHICSPSADQVNVRDNCCVTFTDASPDLERALTQGKGSNCCVMFRRNDARNMNRRAGIILVFMTLFAMCYIAGYVVAKQVMRDGVSG